MPVLHIRHNLQKSLEIIADGLPREGWRAAKRHFIFEEDEITSGDRSQDRGLDGQKASAATSNMTYERG